MPKSRRTWPAPYDDHGAQTPHDRILLVEDDRIDQIVFRKFVRDTGLSYDCTIVGSVSEAKDVLRWSAPFDIVVADYLLGDGTAFDLLDLVKGVPVILVTGAGGEETAVRAWRAGIYDYLVKDRHGDYLHALPITIRNAVEHRRATKELELLSGAIMHASDCIYITDLHGKIVFVNPAFCRTYGYEREQILERDSSILWTGGHPSAPAGCVFAIRTADGKAAVGFYHRRRDGRRFPISLARSIVRDSDDLDAGVVGIARDLSEPLALADEFHVEVKRLAAHDKRYKDLTIAVLEMLDSLLQRKKVNRALRTIMDFREILEIEMEDIPLERTDLDLELLIPQIVKILEWAAGEKGVELMAAVPETDAVVHASRDHIARALTCILQGLIYAVPGKSRIGVRIQDAGNGITIEIDSNDAIGAIRKVYKAMGGFDSFGGHSDPHGDLVLGLFVADRLVALHGGATGIGAGSGQGNVIFITLPKPRVPRKDSVPVRCQGGPA